MVKSGQFIHYATLNEDYEPASWSGVIGTDATKGPFLSLEATVYTFTEILELAARLSESIDYEPELTINATIEGTRDRRLLAGFRRSLFGEYVCNFEAVTTEQKMPPVDLRTHRREIAIRMAAEVLELFSFATEGRVLGDIQQGLIDRRFI